MNAFKYILKNPDANFKSPSKVFVAAEQMSQQACLRAYMKAGVEDYRALRAAATLSIQFGMFHSAWHTHSITWL